MTHYGPLLFFVEQAGLEPAAFPLSLAGRGTDAQLLRVTRPSGRVILLKPYGYPQRHVSLYP